MKMVVLAAGSGSRLYPLTNNTSKMLVEIDNGITLLEKQMEIFAESEVIDEVVYVLGYFADKVEDKLKILSDKYQIASRTIYNPFYDASNNLISLWLARDEFEQDGMITNGDNLFRPEVFQKLNEIKEECILLTVSMKHEYDFDDMKVVRDSKGMLQAIGKEIEILNANAESVGLVKIKGNYIREEFQKSLDQLVRIKENRNCFWLETFNHLHSRGILIRTIEIDGTTQWQEIDFHLDITLAKKMVTSWKRIFEKT